MVGSKFLYPLSLLYGKFVSFRNSFYDKNILKSRKLPIPVISVGNLSVGGTGKTSFVIYLANLLKDKRVCILSRGYKRKTKGPQIVSEYGNIKLSWEEAGDEAYLLAKFLPFASVVVSEDRYKGGIFALEKLSPNVIILDDGFQHRALYRDIDILMIKKEDLRDYLLPAGRLREPIFSINRADIIILTYQEVKPFDFYTGKPTFKMFREFISLLDPNFEEVPIDILKDKEVIAFSGLGDNGQFAEVLRKLNISVKKFLSYRDHYDYKDFEPKEDEIYLTTPKDLVKLEGYKNIFALNFKVKVEREEKLKKLIYRIFC
ncbi:MAG TPA: tetraacyldisaccharide 4'-kinase [Aquifex aeolicus]|nr:tetraacyldisaccharide 4'-kinase [Aquifex aeolicus]